MKEYAAPKFMAYLDAIARVVAEGQRPGTSATTSRPTWSRGPRSERSTAIALTWALGKAEQGALRRSSGQLADVLLRGLAPK